MHHSSDRLLFAVYLCVCWFETFHNFDSSRKSLDFTFIHKLYKLVYCYTVGIADQVSNMTHGPFKVIDVIVLH